MGSKTAIAILEWMQGRTFTRQELENYLDSIGFNDPFAGASLQSPIDRIIQSIKRNGYASYKGKAWEANDEIIKSSIEMHRSMPSQEAQESLQEIKDHAKALFGDDLTDEMIETLIQNEINRRGGNYRAQEIEAFADVDDHNQKQPRENFNASKVFENAIKKLTQMHNDNLSSATRVIELQQEMIRKLERVLASLEEVIENQKENIETQKGIIQTQKETIADLNETVGIQKETIVSLNGETDGPGNITILS